MLTVNTKNGTRIRLYDSIKNLDAGRFNDLRKYVVRDAGIGSSMDAINKHHATMDLLLSKNKLPEAIQERQNLHTFYFLAIEKINIQHITFAIFVHSIDDWIVDDHHKDLTESVYMSVCERIYRSKLKQEQVESIFDDLKKDPQSTMKNLSDWIGLDNSIYNDTSIFTITNKTQASKHKGLFNLAATINMKFENFWRKNKGLKNFLKSLYFKINGSDYKESINGHDRKSLNDYYKHYNLGLHKLLKKYHYDDFPSWLDES